MYLQLHFVGLMSDCIFIDDNFPKGQTKRKDRELKIYKMQWSTFLLTITLLVPFALKLNNALR